MPADCDAANDYQLGMLSEWLRTGLQQTRTSQAELARRLTVLLGRPFDRSMVNKMVIGRRRVDGDEVLAIASILRLQPPEAEDSGVPIVGHVGAGAEAHYYATGQLHHDMAPAPPGATPHTVAMVVRGDSMAGRADDGDIVYFDTILDPPNEDLIGRLCACELQDGRILIKKPYLNTDGTWNLFSTNAEPIMNVTVVRAARVLWIKPR